MLVMNKDVALRTEPEVVAAPEEVLVAEATAATSVPNVANLNINKSTKVQIGPKFVTVTQNVHNAERVKGKCLCFDLVSGSRVNALRCRVVVFVCWALLVATGLAVYFVFITLPSQKTRLDLGLNAEWYVRRDDWQAVPAYAVEFLDLPVHYVIIGHSALKYCNLKYECVEEVLSIQKDHLRRFNDIGPNFLVGGNGYVFEGRGANVLPAMVTSWNTKSVMIMLLGNYQDQTTDLLQIEHINILLGALLEEGVVSEDYVLYGHCQVRSHIISPGAHAVAQLNRFSHWSNTNFSACPYRGQTSKVINKI